MDSPLLIFAVAIFFLLISPGPGVLSLAAVGSAFGPRSGFVYGTGLFVGSNAVMVAAAAGLAIVFDLYPLLRIVFTIVSSGYLLWLAGRIAFAGAGVGFGAAERAPGIGGGLVLQAFNPKAYAVGAFVFAGFPLVPGQPLTEFTLKIVVLNLIWVPIHVAWLGLGIGLRRLDLAPRTQRAVNIGMAALMVAVVALATLASFHS